jgi:hypothetical protein
MMMVMVITGMMMMVVVVVRQNASGIMHHLCGFGVRAERTCILHRCRHDLPHHAMHHQSPYIMYHLIVMHRRDCGDGIVIL